MLPSRSMGVPPMSPVPQVNGRDAPMLRKENHVMRTALIAIVSVVMVSCSAAPPQSGEVTHVVICWLKSPGDDANRQKIIDETAKLRQIPGVVSVAAGRAIPST